jgi:hypothetical protein
MTTAQQIIEYAEHHGPFGINEIEAKYDGINRTTLLCMLSRLVRKGELVRRTRGVYAKPSLASPFLVVLKEQEKTICGLICRALPSVSYCVYNGETLAPLQHHVFQNNATYVEVEREAVETVFHICKDSGFESYKSPTMEMTRDYIDLGKPVVIVKPLVTESPLTQHDGVMVSTLEKLLVDLCKDDDFYFLQGLEETYIFENARTLYDINESRLKRYAKRRNIEPKNFDMQ